METTTHRKMAVMQKNGRNPGRALRELMFEALKSEAVKLNQLAAEALALVGPVVVRELVIELLTSKKVGYRVRLLGVIETIGEVSNPIDHMELFNLTDDKDSRVREAAVRTINALRAYNSKQQGSVQAAEQLC